jgi:hypothetical protein
MKFRNELIFPLLIFLTLIFAVSLIYIIVFLKESLQVKDCLTIAISFSAFFVALISNFKSDVFSFDLKVLSGAVLLLPDTSSNIDIILPIIFVNKGYSDGFIEMIFLKVTKNQQKKKYLPMDDLDGALFTSLTERQQGNERGVKIPFSGFPLPSKQSVKKYIGFGFILEPEFKQWQEGKYKFELYIKASQWKNFRKFSEFEHSIDAETISALITQRSFYLHGRLESTLLEQIQEL